MQIESVPHDLRPDAECPGDQVDARPGLRHLDDLRQHHLVFRRAAQRNHDVAAAARRRSEHYPTVGIQELPKTDRWIIGPGGLAAVERGKGRDSVDRELGDHLRPLLSLDLPGLDHHVAHEGLQHRSRSAHVR